MAGVIPVAAAAGLFYWGATTDLTPAEGLTRADVMKTIGQIAGGVAGLGVVLWIFAIVLRLRGR